MAHILDFLRGFAATVRRFSFSLAQRAGMGESRSEPAAAHPPGNDCTFRSFDRNDPGCASGPHPAPRDLRHDDRIGIPFHFGRASPAGRRCRCDYDFCCDGGIFRGPDLGFHPSPEDHQQGGPHSWLRSFCVALFGERSGLCVAALSGAVGRPALRGRHLCGRRVHLPGKLAQRASGGAKPRDHPGRLHDGALSRTSSGTAIPEPVRRS